MPTVEKAHGRRGKGMEGMKVIRVPAWRRTTLVAMAVGALIAAMSWPVPVVGAADATDRLVFSRETQSARDVYTVDVDGTNLTRIGSGWSPAWSPDGGRIAFTLHNDIYVMDADGSNRRRLTTSPEYYEFGPSWSPDGRRIVFVRQDEACCYILDDDIVGESRLWVMNADGSNARPVATGSDETLDYWSSWSPDGRSIAFERFQGEDPHWGWSIVVLDLETGKESRLTYSGRDYLPTWSVDDRITFSSARHADARTGVGQVRGHSELYRMSSDGTDQVRLTYTDADEFGASSSPDGEIVAFVRDPDGGTYVGLCGWGEFACEDGGELPGAIHLMNADGSGVRALISPPEGASDSSPHFRPDPSRAPAISGTQTPAEPRADTQEEGRSRAQAQGDVDGRASSSGGSQGRLDDLGVEDGRGSTVADRAPTAEGVGVAGDPDAVAGQASDRGAADGWGAALIAAFILGGLTVMGLAGRSRLSRSRP